MTTAKERRKPSDSTSQRAVRWLVGKMVHPGTTGRPTCSVCKRRMKHLKRRSRFLVDGELISLKVKGLRCPKCAPV